MAAVDAEYCGKLAPPALLLFAGFVDICDHAEDTAPGVVDCCCDCGVEPDILSAPLITFGGPLPAPFPSCGESDESMPLLENPRLLVSA
jgi:hypothetical protein